jgi:hypothetical protein
MMLSNVMGKGVPAPKKPEVETESAEEMEMGIEHESAEHGWLSPVQIRRLVKDHLRENEEYYSELKEMEEHDKAEEAPGADEDALEAEEQD